MSRIADISTAIEPKETAATPAPRIIPALSIISHPHAGRAGDRCLLDGLARGRELALSRNAPDFTKPGAALGMPLGDPFVSRKPVRFKAAPNGGVQLLVDEGGTGVVVGAGSPGQLVFSAAMLEEGVVLELANRVVLLLHHVEAQTAASAADLSMIGWSGGIRRVRETIERIADVHVPVLVRGETGTGKELVARALHAHGPRRSGPFVSVNLGAIPKDLAASELFGAVRGAFTGAVKDREGFFRAAHGGTLFLDEVGEASPEVQVMLLRVLETGEIYPVGGHSPISIHVRLVAATDADLSEGIREGRFKAPLLHRLSGYEIHLPPLRARREDIGVLFYHFARAELAAIGEEHRLSPSDPYAPPWLPAALASRLVRHHWPGNIRQLRNVARQLVIGSRGKAQLDIDLPIVRELSPATIQPALAPAVADRQGALRRKPSGVTEGELIEALQACGWDLKPAADRLGIPRSSIYDLIERCPNVRTAGDLSREEIQRCFDDCQGDVAKMVGCLRVSGQALKRRLKEMGLR